MIMDLANRGSLDNVLQDMARIGQAPSDCVLINTGQQLCEALKHMALYGVVHRDISARNVLVFSYSQTNIKDVEVKLTDFGLSTRSGVTLGGGGGGDPEEPRPVRWMSPEALRDGVFTEKSDVWSMGVLLWEMWELRGSSQDAFWKPYESVDEDSDVEKGVIDGSLKDSQPSGGPYF